MAVFICLPCSVKAEIKVVLGVPLIEITDKNYQFSVCNSSPFSTKSSCLISSTSKKQVSQCLFLRFNNNIKLLKQQNTFLKVHVVSAVPTYILHQQYRI